MTVRIHNSDRVEVIMTPPDPEPWMAKARCKSVDPEIFFERENSQEAPGLIYCNPCESKQDCLVFALLNENPNERRYGLYGGTGPAARDRIYDALKGNKNG